MWRIGTVMVLVTVLMAGLVGFAGPNSLEVAIYLAMGGVVSVLTLRDALQTIEETVVPWLAAAKRGELDQGIGAFLTAGGTTVNRIARWRGSGWQPLSTGFNNTVNAVIVFTSGPVPRTTRTSASTANPTQILFIGNPLHVENPPCRGSAGPRRLAGSNG